MDMELNDHFRETVLREKFSKYVDDKDFFPAFIMMVNSVEEYSKLLLDQISLLEDLVLLKHCDKKLYKKDRKRIDKMTLGSTVYELKKYCFHELQGKKRDDFFKNIDRCNTIRVEVVHKLNKQNSGKVFDKLCSEGCVISVFLLNVLVALTTSVSGLIKEYDLSS